MDFLQRTNPWGAADDAAGRPAGAPPMRDGTLDREAVQARLERAFDVLG
ncbi:hypothetical protein [Azospirillum sp. ST 5-10]